MSGPKGSWEFQWKVHLVFWTVRNSRAGWAGQPAQDIESVDDDLQYKEEEEDIGCDLVAHIPTIYIIFVCYLIHKIKYLSRESGYNLVCVSFQFVKYPLRYVDLFI